MYSFLGVLLLFVLNFSEAQHTTPIINIQGLGSVQGSIGQTAWTDRTIYQFRSIPYAEAPIGDLRFQAPVAKKGWTNTLNVSDYGVSCPQLSNSDFDEDCLTLSIFSNDLDVASPVMVYIHGGWFINGNASIHQPNYLLESDIVLVVIQYRLGPLGFLSMQNEEIPGNVAILDMILALQWIQTYIGHFGGNNSQVTIFGESAGSAAVSALLLTPLLHNYTKPLFHKAILQSGSIFSPWAMSRSPIEGTLDIARRVGCSEINAGPCLKNAPVKTLLEAFASHRTETIIQSGYTYVTGCGIVAGDPLGVFPLHPRNYLKDVPPDVEVIVGTTSQDGLFLLEEIDSLHPGRLESINDTHEFLQYIHLLHDKFGHFEMDGTLEGYEIANNFAIDTVDNTPLREIVLGLIDICGNYGIKSPTLTVLHAVSRVNPENSYLYSFDYGNKSITRETSLPISLEGPVRHAQDLLYLFPRVKLQGTDVRIAKTMVQLWTSFASQGIPISNEVQYWPPAIRLYGPYLKINSYSTQSKNYFVEYSATLKRFAVSRSTDWIGDIRFMIMTFTLFTII